MTARGQFFFNPPEPTGFNATTLGLVSAAYGDSSIVIGQNSFSGYRATNAIVIGVGATVPTSGATANSIINSDAIAIGTSATAGHPTNPASNGIAIGRIASAPGANAIAIGGGASTFATTSSSSGSVAIGTSNGSTLCQATQGSAVAIGQGAQATSTQAIALGFSSTASGTNTIALGNSSSATGSSGIALGVSTTASTGIGIGSGVTAGSGIAIGTNISASTGSLSLSIGAITSISAATTIGGSLAPGNFANAAIVMGGNHTVPSTANRCFLVGNSGFQRNTDTFTFSPNAIVTRGDTQASTAVLRISTTTATPAVMFLGGIASNIMVMQNNVTWMFRALVVARRSDTVGDVMGFTIEGVITRGANAASTTMIGTPSTSSYNSGTLPWTVVASADTTSGALTFTATAEASKTVQFVARVDTAEVQ